MPSGSAAAKSISLTTVSIVISDLRRNKSRFDLGSRARRHSHADLPTTAHRSLSLRERLEKIGSRERRSRALYMPLIPELAISMLACARIGATHSVVFGGFSSAALIDRINDAQCKMVVTRTAVGAAAKK